MEKGIKRPDSYTYPAIFSYDEDGVSVSFPDLPGCFTCGDSQQEAMYMAVDVLRGYMSCLEDDGDNIPGPSDFRGIQLGADEALVLVEASMSPARNKTVRKNLTIPADIAFLADRAGVNYSRLLTKALKDELSL